MDNTEKKREKEKENNTLMQYRLRSDKSFDSVKNLDNSIDAPALSTKRNY